MGEGEVDGDPAARRRGGGSSGDPGRASPSTSGRERCHGREREAPGLRCGCPPFPPLYIGPRERGGAAFGPSSKEGCGQGGVPPPQGTSEVPSPFRTLPFPYLLVHGPLGAGALGPCRPRRTPYSPCGPPGQVAPPGGPPGPFRWSRYNTDDPETLPVAETGLPIYKSLPPDHSGTPRDVRDLIRDSEQHSVVTYKSS